MKELSEYYIYDSNYIGQYERGRENHKKILEMLNTYNLKKQDIAKKLSIDSSTISNFIKKHFRREKGGQYVRK